MKPDAEILMKALQKEIANRFSGWTIDHGEISIRATPSITPAFSIKQQIFNQEGQEPQGSVFLSEDEGYLTEYFKNANKGNKFNTIDLKISNGKLASIQPNWDQAIVDEFEKYLPKSKKGKIKAWYLE